MLCPTTPSTGLVGGKVGIRYLFDSELPHWMQEFELRYEARCVVVLCQDDY